MNKPPLWVAHRGESHDAPENTCAAFDLAWQRDCDGIELDIHLSADGQVVVFHNHDLELEGKKCAIAQTSYAALKRHDASAGKAAHPGQTIPRLADVLQNVPAGKRVLVEIKCGPDILPPLSRVLADSPLATEQIELIAFDRAVLDEAGKILPGHKRLLLASIKEGYDEVLNACTASGFDGADVNCPLPLLPSLVETFHQHNLLVYTWTVNDLNDARAHVAANVDGITSDRAAWLRESLRP